MFSVMIKLGLVPFLAGYVIVVVLALDMDKQFGQYALFLPVAYFLGSVPWGYLITHTLKGIDIRQYGSGSIGASNVLRTAGGAMAFTSLVLDLSKGVLAVVLARAVADTQIAEVSAGLAVLMGHNWSVFLGFRGGRGIVPGLGGLLVMSPIAAGLALAVFIPVTLVTKYLSLGSVCAVVAAVLATLVLALADITHPTYLIYAWLGGAIIIWQHRGNIQRVIARTERKLGKPAEKILDVPRTRASRVS